jgi:glutamate dehydrogenase
MTDEVGRLVLIDNYRQNQAISLMERMSRGAPGFQAALHPHPGIAGAARPQIEFLPSDAEFAERKARGQGLTRPELSVLLSYSKIVLFQQLLDSDVPEDPYLSKELRATSRAAAAKLRRAHGAHRLKREIIATAVTNSMVNRMGATFLLRMQEDTGRSPAQSPRPSPSRAKCAQVATTYYSIGEALNLKWLMEKVEELPVETRWHAHARGSLRDELNAQQRSLTLQVLAWKSKAEGADRVAAWMSRDDVALKTTLATLNDMRSQVVIDYPIVSVAVRRVAQLV